MGYQFPRDVEKLVRGYMATGDYASEDDLLRNALQALGEFIHSRQEFHKEYWQTVAAIQEGVADAEAGRMRALHELIKERESS